MYKAINQWSFPGMTAEACIDLAAKAGYEGFEPAFALEGPLSPETTASYWRGLAARAADKGIRLTSLASGTYWSLQLTSSDEMVRQKAMDFMWAHLEAAAALGVDTILVVPGVVDEATPYDAAYDRTLEGLNRMAPVAEKAKVSIGIENVWNKFLLSPLEARDLVDAINSPYVGFYLDLGNIIQFGYAEQWVRILGNRIRKVHIKDFKRSIGTLDGFVDLLAGDVNFPAAVKALEEVGYDGPLIAEMGGYATYKDEVVYRTLSALKRILNQ